jgi:hypothetical protein
LKNDVTRAFITRAAIGSLAIGFLIHLRILAAAPVRTSQPAMWLLLATVQNAATIATFAVLVNVLLADSLPRTARTLFSALTLLRVCLQAALSEIVIFFGHGLFRENLQMALHPTLFEASLRGATVMAIAFFTLLAAIVLALASFSARRHPTPIKTEFIATIAVVAIVASVTLPPVQLSEATSNPFWTITRLLQHDVINNVRGTMTIPEPLGPRTEMRTAMPRRHSEFIDDAYPLAYVPPPRSAAAVPPAQQRPNIVFWLMEGLRAEEVGAYGGTIPNITPNFDALAKQSIFFTDAYSVASFTPEGEIAMWYGVQASPYEVIVRTRPNITMYGLPEILARDGYALLWMHPSSAEMYLSTRFYLHRGFHVLDGRDFAPSLASTNWGYSDRALAETLVKTLDRMPEPFAAMGVTVSNHHPFQVPSDAKTHLDLPSTWPKRGYEPLGFGGFEVGEHTLPRIHTVHYSDEALGYFIELARRKPWFANTIFVIAGDHGTPTKPLDRDIRNTHDFLDLRHRVAMIIFSPLLKPRVVTQPVSHVDLLPTLLGLVGEKRARAGLGIDLLDPADADDHRMVITYSDTRAVRITDAHYCYDVLLQREKDRYTLGTEALYAAYDHRGLNEVSASHPAEVARFRTAARAYIDSYGWLLASGHSGVPANARERGPS